MNLQNNLWNKNFAILWHGQLLSEFGNVAFSVALGFWVLDRTGGNAALMGIIEACFALPAVLLGPLAGAFADRHSRKWIIVLADFLRGILFAAMGAMLFFNAFPFWAIYPIAVLSGALGAFFAPALSSAIPDIVSREELSKANSLRSLSSSSAQLAGNSLGGLLYTLLGAPLMILVNGISFFYAAATQLFMRIPPVAKPRQKKHILHETADGLKFTFGNMGLRALVLMNVSIGFFSTILITLLKPLFNITPGFGPANFGYAIGAMMAGAILGMLAFSLIKVKPDWRSRLFCGIPISRRGYCYPHWVHIERLLDFPACICRGGFQCRHRYRAQHRAAIGNPEGKPGKGVWHDQYAFQCDAASRYGAERHNCAGFRRAAYVCCVLLHHVCTFIPYPLQQAFQGVHKC